MNTQPLVISGALGIARRAHRDAYAQFSYVTVAWLLDAEHLMPPFRQWVVTVGKLNSAGTYVLSVFGVSPPDVGQELYTVDHIADAYALGPPVFGYHFRPGSEDLAVELCARMVTDLVCGNIFLTMSEPAWQLYVSGIAYTLGRRVQ